MNVHTSGTWFDWKVVLIVLREQLGGPLPHYMRNTEATVVDLNSPPS